MGFSSTKEQSDASNPNHSVWVTANAGTGKTKILTDRVIKLLLNGVQPDQILCITFTKAGAAEMKNRVNEVLAEFAIMPDNQLESDLQTILDKDFIDSKTKILARSLFTRVIDFPDSLKIQTIHSLCQSILKRFPLESDNILPHFKVIEEQEEEELLKSAWKRIITKLNQDIDEKDKEIASSIEYIIKIHTEISFKDVLKEIINKRQKFFWMIEKYGNADNAVKHIYKELGIPANTSIKSLNDSFTDSSDYTLNDQKILVDELASITKTATSEKSFTVINNWLYADKNDRLRIIDQYCKIFLTAKKLPKKITSIISKKNLDSLSDSSINFIEREQERICKYIDNTENINIIKQTRALMIISEAMLAIYHDLKSGQGVMDNNDLIIYTEKLLSRNELNSWVMYKLDQKVNHILVDEAQDTNFSQWNIIKSLCSEFYSGSGQKEENRTIFVVGDEKQSIFSFQGSDPDVFENVKNYFAEKTEFNKKIWKDIKLSTSFRSSPPILEAVDAIFNHSSRINSVSKTTNIIYHESFFKNNYGKVELWPISYPIEKEDDNNNRNYEWDFPIEYKEHQDGQSILINKITDQIKLWLDQKRYMPNKNRPIEPKDIMILLKNRGSFVDEITKSMKKKNIPVSGVDRMDLNNHIAIMDLIALGKWVLFIQDDLSLANILKSPICGLNEDDLFFLTHDRGKISLWENITKNKDHNINISNCFKLLIELSELYRDIGVFEFYSYIIDVINIRKKYSERIGNEVHEYFDEFLNITMDFDKNHTSSLQHFININGRKERTIKRDLESEKNEVRVMTIHGSKGLQSPIIFLPDTIHRNNNKDNLKWLDSRNKNEDSSLFIWNTKHTSDITKEIIKNTLDKEYEESLRLLYVAMTRAESELYISGYQNKRPKSVTEIYEKSWYNIIKSSLADMAVISKDKNGDEIYIIESKSDNKSNTYIHENNKQIENTPPIPEYFSLSQTIVDSNTEFITPSINKSESHQPLRDTEEIKRGNIIHYLLEVLVKIEPEKRYKAAKKFLTNSPMDDKESIIREVISVLEDPELSFLFSTKSKSEVAITGNYKNHVISGQIDRLVITDDIIYIIDYKTSRNPPKSSDKIPHNYLRQISLYKHSVSDIYKDREIICYLLWTHSLQLQKIDNNVIEKTLSIL